MRRSSKKDTSFARLPRITFHFRQLVESMIGIRRNESARYSQSIRATIFNNSLPCTNDSRMAKNAQLITTFKAVIIWVLVIFMRCAGLSRKAVEFQPGKVIMMGRIENIYSTGTAYSYSQKPWDFQKGNADK